MDIKGTVIRVEKEVSGTSKRTGEEWKRQDYVLEFKETPEQRDFDSIVLSLFGKDKVDSMKLAVGDEMEVSIGHFTEEYNGRVYNKIKVFSERKVASVNTQDGVRDTNVGKKADDLPFI